MATAAPMSHSQQPNRKLGNLAQDCFTDGIVDHDMHLKMSKKIAQLTKVIYALNTKNDEHEQIMKAIQQQHDKEKQQMLEETRLKLERFQNRLGVETDLRRKIQSLEENIDEHEKQKKTLLQSIELMKSEWTDKESVLQTTYSQQVSSLNKQLEQYQGEFESKIATFQSLVTEFEHEKMDAVSDIKRCHQLEMENLLKARHSESTGREEELLSLKQKYEAETAQLKALCDSLKAAKESMETDYEEKLKKLKALYDKEIELLKVNQSESFSEREALLQEKLEKLTKDLQFQEVQSRKRIEGLLEEASKTESTMTDLQTQVSQLQQEQSSHKLQVENLQEKLKQAEEARDQYLQQSKDIDSEYRKALEQNRDQANAIQEKSLTIEKLLELKSENEARIQAMTYQISDLKRNLKLVEEERDSLLSKSSNDSKQKTREVQSLEEALEELRIEKQAQRDKYEVDISGMEKRLKDMEQSASSELRLLEERLNAEHLQAVSTLKEKEQERINALEQDWKTKLESELLQLEAEKKKMEDYLQTEITSLKNELESAQKQLEELCLQVGDKASNLGAATKELAELQQQVKSLEQQLEQSQTRLQTSADETNKLNERLETLSKEKLQLLEDHEKELARQLEELKRSLNQQWSARLEKEISQVKSQLIRDYEQERASSLDQLASSKEHELNELKRSYKDRISSLNSQISELQKLLNKERLLAEQKMEEMESKYNSLNKELTEQLERRAQEYERKIEEVRTESNARLLEELEAKSAELETMLTEAKAKHMEEMSAQMTAHKVAVDMVKRENESLRLSEQQEQRQRSANEKEALQLELCDKHQKELEKSTNTFTKQITTLRMELQRAAELSRQKEAELRSLREDFDEKLDNREQSMRNLQAELNDLDSTILKLNKEVEKKGQEILKVRSDTNSKLRALEKELAEEHLDEMQSLKSRHSEETQQILAEFTKAQTILKDKIEDLSSMLEEAEERYRNREPREQDLDMIEQLRHALAEREQQMQQLLAEKQFYQMELVNRETNFTKVFAGGESSNKLPQVGFINPLAKKKKNEKGPTKYTVQNGSSGSTAAGGSAGSQQRLRPIAGSPIHEDKLNPNHVLPPPQAFSKKFVQ